MALDGNSINTGLADWLGWLKVEHEQSPIRFVADFGCGAGKLSKSLVDTIGQPEVLVGLDIFAPTISRLMDGATVVGEVPFTKVARWDFRRLVRPKGKSLAEVTGHAGEWDLWMFGDCLEHVERDVALEILDSTGPRMIAARIPVGNWPQGPVGGNKAEEHLWSFFPSDLRMLKNRKVGHWLAECTSNMSKKYEIPRRVEDRDHDESIYRVKDRGHHIGNVLLTRGE